MLQEIEGLIQSVLVKLLDKGTKFYFVSSILHFIESPFSYNFLKIASFAKDDYKEFEQKISNITQQIQEYSLNNKGYTRMFHTLVSDSLSEYSYIFHSKNNLSVQSSLIFLLVQTLSKTCLEGLMEYICEKELTEVISRPQIYNSSIVFSTIIHELLHKEYDELALKMAIHLENKAILFLRDIDGVTPLELAEQKGCFLTFEYVSKLYQIGEYMEGREISEFNNDIIIS